VKKNFSFYGLVALNVHYDKWVQSVMLKSGFQLLAGKNVAHSRVELDLLCSSIEEVEVSKLESNPLSHFTNELVAALDILRVGPWKMIVFFKDVANLHYCTNQCCGSMTFWGGSGSGSADPCL
jgi:hypothetical protein